MLTAVIALQGHQYLVQPGETLTVDFLEDKPKPEVLLVYDNDKIMAVGKEARRYRVDLKVVTPKQKGKKITVRTYKAKSRYRRQRGFRPLQTVVKVVKIAKNVQK